MGKPFSRSCGNDSAPTEKRVRVIHRRFDEQKCSSVFEIVEIIDRSHIVLKCKECGFMFNRMTRLIDEGIGYEIKCPVCGAQPEGGLPNKRARRVCTASESEIAEYYQRGFSIRQTAMKFGASNYTVNKALANAGVTKRCKVTNKVEEEYAHEITGEPFLDEEFVCANCGRQFTRYDYMVASNRTKRVPLRPLHYCSNKCSQRASHKFMNRQGRHNELRAKREAVNRRDKIALGDLMERDNNICQICGEEVDLNDITFDENGNAHTGRKYPTIDHIKPLALGGATVWDNVRLACKSCNSKKHTSLIRETTSSPKTS